MGTISAKKIEEALAKARDVGLVEEPFQLGDVSVVLRNLRPNEYVSIYEENNDREGMDHLFGFQKSHLCRSLVEVNGLNLRDIQFVEIDEEVVDPKTNQIVIDPKTNSPKMRTVKLELHDYILRYILNTWGKETVAVAWRKFGDVLKLAEDKAADGVKFVLPEETPEETLRRCIEELREAMSGVPDTLLTKVLEEAGLIRISTAEELKKAMDKADDLARETATTAPDAATPPPAPIPSQPVPSPEQQGLGPTPPSEPRVRPISPQEIMARRQPLNQQAIELPSGAVAPTIAAPPGPVTMGGPEALPQRSQKIAQLEQLEMPTSPLAPLDPSVVVRVPGQEQNSQPVAALLDRPGRERVDLKQFSTIVEQPPRAGINPRFRPPGRGV